MNGHVWIIEDAFGCGRGIVSATGSVDATDGLRLYYLGHYQDMDAAVLAVVTFHLVTDGISPDDPGLAFYHAVDVDAPGWFPKY